MHVVGGAGISFQYTQVELSRVVFPWYFGENSTKMLRFATLFFVVCLAVGILNGAEVSPACFVVVVSENTPGIFK